jgi:tetratricopeptide (TPR) repeat protein
MAGDDWFRNRDWDSDTEAAFRARLARARSGRPQYLHVQAACLADCHPHAALALIDEYFGTGDEFDVSQALGTRAAAYRALGKIDDAVAAYKQALEWEGAHPHVITTARIDLPKLVAEQRLAREYAYVLDILLTRFGPPDHQLPDQRYLWNGCHALIASDMGHAAEAREFAERALRAAAKTEGPFRKHRAVGVVRGTADDFGERIIRIARPSGWRGLFRRPRRPT